MERSLANVGQMPLDEYVGLVARIYCMHDNHRSIWDVWCHTLHHAAGIAEQIRMGATENKLHTEIADFSLWLFTAVLKLTGKFGQSEGRSETPVESLIRIQSSCSDLLWHKYPKVCPLCFARRIADRTHQTNLGSINRCDCRVQQPRPEGQDWQRRRFSALRDYSQEIRGEKPTGVDEWQNMFGTIFADNLSALSLTDIALHLMEELGEASDAMIRMYSYTEEKFRSGEPNWRQLKLEAQLADVFSWLFALVEKLGLLKQGDPEHERHSRAAPGKSVRLSEIIWERYGSDEARSFYCPFCKGTTCSCPIILVPATRPIEDLMERFQRSEEGTDRG